MEQNSASELMEHKTWKKIMQVNNRIYTRCSKTMLANKLMIR